MKTVQRKVNDLLNRRNSKLVVPDYQRFYGWKVKNCKKLLSDILEYATTGNFWIGFTIFKDTCLNYTSLNDGQQRIATFSIMYAALRDVILNVKKFKNDPVLLRWAEVINEMYLVDGLFKHTMYPTKNRLVLRDEDDASFDDIINGNIKPDNKDILTKNYRFFYNTFKTWNKDAILKFIDATENVTITETQIEPEDNEILIYNTINSTGMELNAGDLIKSTIFSEIEKVSNGLEEKEHLNKKLSEIEVNSFRNMDRCLRYWHYVNTNKWISTKDRDIYLDEIKSYMKNRDVRDIIDSLLKFSTLYKDVLTFNYKDSIINDFLKKTFRNNDNFYILVFDVLYNESLTPDEKINILKVGENILFRKWVCGHGFLHNTFAGILRKSLELDGDRTENFIKTIRETPTSNWGPTIENAIPTDDEFIEAFKTKDFYRCANKGDMKKYVFNALENNIHCSDTKEYIDVYEMMNNGNVTTEHIIPQTKTPEWEQELGDDVDEIYEVYINTIPNLTITGYNSEYSNKSFQEKKKMENGFSVSSFKLNRQLSEFEHFGKKELLERQDFLVQVASRRWKV